MMSDEKEEKDESSTESETIESTRVEDARPRPATKSKRPLYQKGN